MEQTGKLFGISRERVRNIEGIAIRKLKHASRSSYLRILTKSSAELLEYKLHQALHDIREQKTEKLLEQISHGLVIVNFAPAQLQYLCRSVDEIEIGVRSYNNLKNADIKTIYELVQKNEADMLKSRWFGRKNIQEIKDILAGMGLSLGMHFDEATERAYEALKKR
ncbi:MAG: hypothetical protein HY007_03950 [Candidatus Sungbacteria bacterium]|nr:hypothetical protein [Candidatus Sungbacteria bacterium]